MKNALLISTILCFLALSSNAWADDAQALKWSAVDTDNSGQISPAEFEAAQIRRASQQFGAHDLDGNKELSAAEFAPIVAQMEKMRTRVPWIVRRRLPKPHSFEKVDTNNSGGISLAEWLAAGQKQRRKSFERADEDDSGTLSKDELQQLKKKMKRFAADK